MLCTIQRAQLYCTGMCSILPTNNFYGWFTCPPNTYKVLWHLTKEAGHFHSLKGGGNFRQSAHDEGLSHFLVLGWRLPHCRWSIWHPCIDIVLFNDTGLSHETSHQPEKSSLCTTVIPCNNLKLCIENCITTHVAMARD